MVRDESKGLQVPQPGIEFQKQSDSILWILNDSIAMLTRNNWFMEVSGFLGGYGHWTMTSYQRMDINQLSQEEQQLCMITRTKVAGLLLAGKLPDITLCKLPPPDSIVLVAGKSHIWSKILPNTPLKKATTEKLYRKYKQQTLKS